jgi:cysteine synthase
MDRPGGLAAIGNTPVTRLARMAGDGDAEVWVKMEAANPTGSYKDRMALAMIEAAEASGRLRPGQLVVEYTGGSTSSSLAFVCAVKGYPLRIVSSDAFSAEKIRTMRAFGAEVELIPSPEGITPGLIPSTMRRAAELTAQTGAFATDQFSNADMVDGYRKLGEELLGQLPGPPPVGAFASYVGTAGCFLGVSRALAAALPALHRAVVEPAESAVLSGGPPGTHHIEGGVTGRAPAAAPSGRLRRGHCHPRSPGVRHGPPRRPRRRHLLRTLDRREPCRRARYRPPARPRPPGSHPAGRQRPEIPHRPALPLTRPPIQFRRPVRAMPAKTGDVPAHTANPAPWPGTLGHPSTRKKSACAVGFLPVCARRRSPGAGPPGHGQGGGTCRAARQAG